MKDLSWSIKKNDHSLRVREKVQYIFNWWLVGLVFSAKLVQGGPLPVVNKVITLFKDVIIPELPIYVRPFMSYEYISYNSIYKGYNSSCPFMFGHLYG